MTKVTTLSWICFLILLAGCGNYRYGYLTRTAGGGKAEKKERLNAVAGETTIIAEVGGDEQVVHADSMSGSAAVTDGADETEATRVRRPSASIASPGEQVKERNEVLQKDPPQPIRVKSKKAQNAFRFLSIAALLFVLSILLFVFVVESWFIILSDLLYSILFVLVSLQIVGSFAFLGFAFFLGMKAMKEIRNADKNKVHYTNKAAAVAAVLIGGFITALLLASLASALDPFLSILVFLAIMVLALKSLF